MRLQEIRSLLEQNYDFDGVDVRIEGGIVNVAASGNSLKLVFDHKPDTTDVEYSKHGELFKPSRFEDESAILEFDGNISELASTVMVRTILGTKSKIHNETTLATGTVAEGQGLDLEGRLRVCRSYIIITMIALMANDVELDLSKDIRVDETIVVLVHKNTGR